MRITNPHGNATYVIEDSRQGWVESLRLLLLSYFKGGSRYTFDYSKIRPAGTPVKGFGGIASGPDSLLEMHQAIEEILSPAIGTLLTVTHIVDIMNIIGRCVVSGNVFIFINLIIDKKNRRDCIWLTF